MKVQESGENYLEVILQLQQEKGKVKAIDVARAMDFSKPSVSRALGILRDAALIDIDNKGYIIFTDEGLKKAESVYDRHIILTNFFKKVLNVSGEIAERDACRVEHVISEETFSAIKKALDK